MPSRSMFLVLIAVLMAQVLWFCERQAESNRETLRRADNDSLSAVAADSIAIAPEIQRADSLYAKAEALLRGRETAGVEPWLREAANIYRSEAALMDDSLLWVKYYRCQQYYGEYLRLTGAFQAARDSAQKNHQETLARFGEVHPLAANSYNSLGTAFYSLGALREALENFQHALRLWSKLPEKDPGSILKISINSGIIAFRVGNYMKAIELFTQALQPGPEPGAYSPDSSILFNIHNSISGAYFYLGDYDHAFYHLEKAFEMLGGSWHDQALYYSNQAILLYSQGDYESALQLNRQALQLRLSNGAENTPHIADNYNNWGNIYEKLEDYPRALEHYQKYLQIHLALPERDTTHIVTAYENIGVILLKTQQLGAAKEKIEASLAMRRQLFPEGHADLASNYLNLGDYYAAKKLYSSALLHYRKALDISMATGAEKQPAVSQAYRRIGDLYLEQKNPGQALHFYQKSLSALSRDFNNPDESANPAPEQIQWRPEAAGVLSAKADAFLSRFAQTGKPRDLEQAMATLTHATGLIERTRSDYHAEASKFILSRQAANLYGKSIRTALALHRLSGDPAWQEAAWGFSEKAKSGVLLETIWKARARRFAGIPDSLLQQELALRQALIRFETQAILESAKLPRERDEELIEAAEKEFRSLKFAYDRLTETFENHYPEYHRLIYEVPHVSLPEVQRRLENNTALLEYFVGGDSIYIFAVTPADLRVTAISNDPEIKHLAETLRSAIDSPGNYSDYAAAAYQLYRYLLQPAREAIAGRRLIIIPDDFLTALPFEALLTKEIPQYPDSIDFQPLPYLLQQHAVSYNYSAALLLETFPGATGAAIAQNMNPRDSAAATSRQPAPLQGQRFAQSSRDLIAIAPVFKRPLPPDSPGALLLSRIGRQDTARSSTAPLLASEKEVERIAALFRKTYGFFERLGDRLSSSKTRLHLGLNATEERIKSGDLQEYRYVHFATHGFLDQNDPRASGLLFYPGANGEDGVLFAGEVFNLRLNADLVALSACQSGSGKYLKGEGLIGLSRGFRYAGAQNLLVSLWNVNDASTAQLMLYFYDALLRSEPTPEALREAKLKLMKENFHHAKPFFWAPFILIGQ